MRTGPRPIFLHLVNAMQIAAQQDKNFSLERYLQGLAGYMDSLEKIKPQESRPVAWQKGDVQLYGSLDNDKANVNVLLVPSLINGSEIFDLMPGYSFYAFLQQEGFNPLLLDWGNPERAGKETLDNYIADFLVPAITELPKQPKPLFVLGYCMGGLMVISALQNIEQDNIHPIFMATPWDFHAGVDVMIKNAGYLWQQGQLYKDVTDFVPIDLLQAFFASVDPENTAQKFANFLEIQDETAKTLFILIEDWLNNGHALNHNIFETCMHDWYLQNETGRGAWKSCGRVVTPAAIKNPSLCVIPTRDKLVPPSTAKPLCALLKQNSLIEPETGHIGLMGSIRAKEKVWTPIVKWMKEIYVSK